MQIKNYPRYMSWIVFFITTTTLFRFKIRLQEIHVEEAQYQYYKRYPKVNVVAMQDKIACY